MTKLIAIAHSLSSYGSISQNSLHLHLTVQGTFQAKLLSRTGMASFYVFLSTTF